MKKKKFSGAFLSDRIVSQPTFVFIVIVFLMGSLIGCLAANQAMHTGSIFLYAANFMGNISLLMQKSWMVCFFISLAKAAGCCLLLVVSLRFGLLATPFIVFLTGAVSSFASATLIYTYQIRGFWLSTFTNGISHIMALPLILLLAAVILQAKGRRKNIMILFSKNKRFVWMLAALLLAGCFLQATCAMKILPFLW